MMTSGMQAARGRTRWRNGLLPAVALLAALGGAGQAHAQAPAPADAAASAQPFRIAPQPLLSALADFSRATGLQASAPAALLAGRNSAGVTGTLPPSEALRRLLAGTGLTGGIEGGAVRLIQLPPAPAADGTLQLPPVEVTGERPGGRWAANGFVAEESAVGTKTDTPLIETPQAVNVVTRNQMDAQGSQTVGEALRYTPGVVVGQFGSTDLRYDWLAVRGFTPIRYLDGLRLPFGASGYAQPRLDPYALERIEILKGPASALYGQSSPGGLLNMISRRPTATPQHEIELQAGSHDRKQAGFDFSGPVISGDDRFLYRLTGAVRDNDTATDHLDGRNVFIAPAFTWRPTAQTSLTLLAQYQKSSSDGGGAQQALPALGTLYGNVNGHIPRSRFSGEPGYDHYSNEQVMAGYSLRHQLSENWELRQNLRYSHVDTDSQRVQAIALGADQRTLSRYGWAFPEVSSVFTIDNQAETKFTTGPLAHRLLMGFDYQYEETRYEESQLVAVSSINIFAPVYGASVTRPPMARRVDLTRHQAGVYAQDEIRLDQWILTLGGRYDRAQARTDTYTVASNSIATVKQDDGSFTGRVGLVRRFDNGLAPYVSYSTSFQPTSGTDKGGSPFDPTKGKQYEAGIRYQPPGTNSLISLSAFHVTQSNVLTVDSTDTRFNTQTGEAEVRGIELEGKASLTQGLSMSFSYAYTESEVTRANRNAAGVSTLGKQLPFAPNHQASLWADYDFGKASASSEGALSGLGMGAGFRYLGASYGDAANVYRAPSATLFDASIRYDMGKLLPAMDGAQFALTGLNLLDKRYVTACISAAGCYYGNGRTVLASLKYRW